MFFDLFKRRKKEKKEIRFDELANWLNTNEDIKNIFNKFEQETNTYFKQLNGSFDKINNKLPELSSVNLNQRKADEKIKRLVLQNRDIYVEHVKNLLNILKKEIVKYEHKTNLDELEQFIKFSSAQLDLFLKQTFKSFHFDAVLNFIPLAMLKPFFPVSKNHSQGTKKEIYHREISIANIR